MSGTTRTMTATEWLHAPSLGTLHVRRDFTDGWTQEWDSDLRDTTPADALASRAKRLKNARTPHTVDGMTITYKCPEPAPHTVTLTYRDPS